MRVWFELEIYVHWQKIIRAKRTYPVHHSTPVTVFVIAEILLWNIQALRWFLLLFCEKLSIIAWVDYFVLQVCERCLEKKNIFKFYEF